MPIKKSLLEVKNVSYAFGANIVLENISFAIESGKYCGLIGPNGGGKTTLLKLILGLLPVQSGNILVNGQKISDMPDRHIIGYVPQKVVQANVDFPATVYEIVESGITPRLHIAERVTKKDRKAIADALEITNLTDLSGRLLSDLSGGQRQRVFIARVIAARAKILLLDEPFVGIDIATQEAFYTFLKSLNKQYKFTIIFVSHDIDVITTQADEILCLNRRLVCQTASKEFREGNVIEKLYGKKVTHIHRHIE